MKKCLSLIVVFALILTTLAMPMTASAYEASLLAVSQTEIAVGFAAKLNGQAIDAENPAHPGDKITVDVVATAENVNVNNLELTIEYDTDVLDFTTVNDDTLTEGKEGVIDYAEYDVADKPITAEGYTLTTLNFTVLDVVSTTFTLISFNITDSSMMYIDYVDNLGNITEYKLVTSSVTVNIAQNTAAAYVDGTEALDKNGKTYIRATGATLDITIDGTNISAVTLTRDGALYGDTNAETREISLGEDGAYVLKISVTGAADVVYNFNLRIGEVNAKLNMAVKDKNPNGYYYTATEENVQTISVPVVISGLGENVEAAMVTFNVSYDETELELDTSTLSVEPATDEETFDYVVKYGTEGVEEGLADGATVATLNFTVRNGAAVGLSDIEISAPSIALVTNYIYSKETSIAIESGKDTITIVPAEGAAFATVTPAEIETAWVQSQEVTVAPFTGADGAVYVAIAEGGELGDLATVYANNVDNAITDSFTAQEEKDYYVITKIGDVYQAKKLANGTDIKVDVTAPSVDASSLNMSAWESTIGKEKTIDLSTLTPTDNKSTYNFTYEWKMAEDTDYVVATDNKITFGAGTTYNDTIEIVVIDEAGNKDAEEPATIIIKLDGNAPVVALNANPVNESGKIVVDITVTENEEIDTVEAYYGTIEGEVTVDAIEALGDKLTVTENKFTADREVHGNGTYYVVATDKATNNGFDYVAITFGEASQASVAASVVSGVDPVEGVFKSVKAYTDDENCVVDKKGAKITSNGSFTYVKFEVVASEDSNYVNKIYVDGEEVVAGYVEYSNDVIDDIKEHTIVVKQEHITDETDVAEATYVFSIVDDANMPSVNADTRFNMVDRAYIKAMTLDKTGDTILPDATDEFYGGIYSGDVDGDFNYTVEDMKLIIDSIKAGNKKGDYTFPIFNPATGE